MLEHRDALAPALNAMASELPAGRYRHELSGLVAQLDRGATAEQLCQGPKAINLLLPLLAAGAQPAAAADRYQKMFAESYREQEFRNQRWRVLAYPALVSLIALGVLVFLCVVVVPLFHQVFRSFELSLPGLTLAVLQLSKWLRSQTINVIAISLLAMALLYVFWRVATSLALFDKIFGYLTSGSSRQVSAMAAFTRRLADGLAADMPLPVAIRLAGESSRRRAIQRDARQLADDAADAGQRLDRSRVAGRFPATLIYAISDNARPLGALPSATGAGSGAGDTKGLNTATTIRLELLQQLAEVYTDRTRYRWDWTTGALAPFSIVLVGLVVAIVLLPLLLPLIQLIDALT